MAKPEMKTKENASALDLRDWLKDVKRLEQLEQISGAHWDLEIGALTEIILERMATPPAIVFDAVFVPVNDRSPRAEVDHVLATVRPAGTSSVLP